MFTGLSAILETISSADSYNKKPPIGPPEDRPTLTDEDLEKLQQTAYGQMLGKDYAYSSIKLVGDIAPVDIEFPAPKSMYNKHIWGIDGSNKTLDYSAFQVMISRAALVEYRYSKYPLDSHHEITHLDNSGICMVDGNIFSSDLHLYGKSTKGLQSKNDVSWIEVMENTNEPLIVSFDPNTSDKKPSSHASGWGIKFMQSLELMALSKVPKEKFGVVIRDGAMFPICATIKDTHKSLQDVLNWKQKMMICSSKRINESTLFVEFLTNPNNEEHREYFFPNQNVSQSILNKLPADYILLPKILKPGQRTPFLEAIPRSRKAITGKNEDLTPVCCYYMRKRKPHTIIRLEFPRAYLDSDPIFLEWSLGCVAWQHELGTKVPQIQELADRRCQVTSEAELIQKITKNALMKKGLEAMETYE